MTRCIAAGVLVAVALGIKNSAVGLAPLAFLLLAAEAISRARDREWRHQLALGVGAFLLAAYVALVVIYRGDAALAEYRYSLDFVFRQVSETRAPAYLLGRTSNTGLWYFFPVAFLYKTSAALHLLLLFSVLYLVTQLRSLRAALASPLRAPVLAALVFALMLARSQLHIGFRYALPMLPMLAVIVGYSASRIWSVNWQRLKPAVAVALVWLVLHPLTYFPNFLSYLSEYGPGRSRNYQVLADSSLDWGQGLLQLRDLMRERGIESVYLSYFGSALPSGYGIKYRALPSFFPLPSADSSGAAPQYVAISATNLSGAYFGTTDPFRDFREREPDAVAAQTIYLYRVSE